jgi:hypothetical protein
MTFLRRRRRPKADRAAGTRRDADRRLTLVERGAPGWLNLLVILSFWNVMKFAWAAVLSPLSWLHGTS